MATVRMSYNWKQWFDGNVWLLEENVDYLPGHRHSVTKSGYRWATRHNMVVKMKRAANGGLLVQRVLSPGEKPPLRTVTETLPNLKVGDPLKLQAERPQWDERDRSQQ